MCPNRQTQFIIVIKEDTSIQTIDCTYKNSWTWNEAGIVLSSFLSTVLRTVFTVRKKRHTFAIFFSKDILINFLSVYKVQRLKQSFFSTWRIHVKKKMMCQYRLQFGQSAPVLRNQSWQTHKIHIIGGFNNKINSKCKLRSVKYSVEKTIHFSIHDSLCKYSFYSVRISSVGGLHSFLQTSVLLIFRTNSYKNCKRGHWYYVYIH